MSALTEQAVCLLLARSSAQVEAALAGLGDVMAGDIALTAGVPRESLSALLDAKHTRSPELYSWSAAAAAVQLIRRVYH